ncbi:MAG: Na(+)-translocating NADH-quinone reductase subunit A [Myxococcota bacterium]
MHEIEKGLDLPISGSPIQRISGSASVDRVAVMADDFPGMKPAMRVNEGDTVKRGQVLFEDRKTPGVLHTAPGAGRVIAVNRGAKRALQSVVIALSEAERKGWPLVPEQESFSSYSPNAADSRDSIVALLVESGQWTALRRRPFAKVPNPSEVPHSVFVTAIDTNPLAPLPDVVIEKRREDFLRGLEIVAKLSPSKTYLCIGPNSDADEGVPEKITVERFTGPHPAGNAGMHIHTLDPVNREKCVWQIGYQDVIAIGHLFATGELDVTRVVSIGGPVVADPRLVEARLGASVDDLAGDEGNGQDVRTIAGSVWSGKTASGEVFGYLGRYHNQVSVLAEGRERVFLGWLTPGWNAFSSIPIYLSRMMKKKFDFTTTTNGSPRTMVPIGMYEQVMPMDILPTFLLRSLVVGDIEEAEKLGALELEEEDLALCSFVCPGKTDYGPLLRKNLEMIEKEG